MASYPDWKSADTRAKRFQIAYEKMTSPELYLLSLARAFVEVAGYALIGRGALTILAGRTYEHNVIYHLMEMISRPAVKLVRLITPRLVVDKHIPFITFFVLFWLWIGLALVKHYLCSMQEHACIA